MPKDAKATAKLAGLLDLCTCGAPPVVWTVESGPTIRCLACGRRTTNHIGPHLAALAWNCGKVAQP